MLKIYAMIYIVTWAHKIDAFKNIYNVNYIPE